MQNDLQGGLSGKQSKLSVDYATTIVGSQYSLSSDYILPERGLCAHRGAMQSHPENTLAAFREALKAGAHMIEFDVQLTSDNELVIMHDLTVDRTTSGSGRVSDFTLAELKLLDAGLRKSSEFEGERIPTLKETLKIMPYNIWLNVHIKGEGALVKLVAQMLKEEERLHQAFLACSAEAAALAREAVPGIMICNMDRQGSKWDYVKSTIAMEADFIQLTQPITEEFAQYAKALKEKGIRINYYGTDSPDEIKMLFDYGIDFPLVNDIRNAFNVAKKEGISPVKSDFKEIE
ncbi:MAG: glycerophosphodiester phosphodiesterase family protein [Prolixibacteraceae bacterium]|nr:glycerophosphodiester phosphodiesterase family protein [Prolixibacteraceae bacterium]